MNRKLIRKVAKTHKTTVKDVREQMQAAIDHAYTNRPTPQALSVNRKGEKPTPDEVVGYAVKEIKAKHD
jgi:hypothetical protein